MTASPCVRPSLLVLLAALAPALVACSGSDASGDGESNEKETPNGEGMPSGEEPPSGDDWKPLIAGEWTMPAYTEDYVCVRQTVEETMYIVGFEAINPPGTHHTLLTMGDPNGEDGTFPCSAADNYTLGVFGSGVGTDPIALPEGVALKVEAGKQLMLNLHLFNTTGDDISGTSGTRIRTVDESEVVHLAEGLLGGPIFLEIPPQETTEHVGYCTMQSEVTIFAVSPHMHQLGIHEKIVAESSIEGERVLHDGPYDFNEQKYVPVDPIKMAAGDKVRVECTHRNTTDQMVTFGESSTAEMCLAGIYRYPADGSLFFCSDDLSAGIQPTL